MQNKTLYDLLHFFQAVVACLVVGGTFLGIALLINWLGW